MPLAVSMYSYHGAIREGRLDISSFIVEAKRIGADGVELLDFYYRDADRDRARAQEVLAESGVPVPIFSVSNDFAKPDFQERQEQVRRIEFGVEEALVYGAKVVRVFAGDLKDGVSDKEAFGWIVEGLVTAADFAQDRNVRLALENHGKLAGRGSQVREIVDAVRQRCGHHALGANPDTGNFLLVDEAPESAIASIGDVAAMVHFKDFQKAPQGFGGHTFSSLGGQRYLGSVIGDGDVDLSACVAALRHTGFDGWYSLEYEGAEDPMVAVPRSLDNARRILG